MTENELIELAFLIGFCLAIVFFMFQFIDWLLDTPKRQERKRIQEQREKKDKFKQLIVQSILRSQPSWDELNTISETNQISTNSLNETIKEIKAEIATGKEVRLSKHKKLLEEYQKEFAKLDPFYSLPPSTREQFDLIASELKGKKVLLKPLASQFNQLREAYQEEKDRQDFKSTASLVVGLLSLVLAIYVQFIR